MRIENKTYYYFEEYEKGLFTDFLWESHTSMREFAQNCDISVTLLSMIVNGKRAITLNVLKKFEENGFKVEL